jgi:hypothetical protein
VKKKAINNSKVARLDVNFQKKTIATINGNEYFKDGVVEKLHQPPLALHNVIAKFGPRFQEYVCVCR